MQEQPLLDSAQPEVQNTNHSKPEGEKHYSVRSTLSTIGILLLAPLIAVGLTIFVFQSYQVDGPSMETTLQHNDRLIVWKLGRTWSRITGNQYVPNRGDIIILNETGLSNYTAGDDAKQLVKRVIALPGERIVIENNVVTVYNKDYPEGFQPDTTLPYGKDGAIPPTMNNLDVRLSETELFVCGDNRPNSLDSRTFGPIQTDQVVGKLVARIFPINNFKKF
ncbi:signal peptidase I [Candidatus Saccharibacteria bacterium]|nr:MAG: signal peptidase I [Candidatus Saccharibacteria bacterium]